MAKAAREGREERNEESEPGADKEEVLRCGLGLGGLGMVVLVE